MKYTENILILPDIHHKIKKAARIINRHTDWQVGKSLGIFDELANIHEKSKRIFSEVDKVISLGDFQDNFGDSPEMAKNTALFTCELLEHDNFVWIQSNHDQAYAYCTYRGSPYGCSGFTFEKQRVVKEVMGERLYQNQLAYWTGITPTDPNGFLISHAGLHPSYLPYIPGGNLYSFNWEWLEKRLKEAQDKARAGIADSLLMAGRSRGGGEPFGGITWLDWSDFEPIPGIRQITGHSPSNSPRRILDSNYDDNWCLDTHLNHYGILTIEKDRDESGEGFSIQKLQVYNLDGSLW